MKTQHTPGPWKLFTTAYHFELVSDAGVVLRQRGGMKPIPADERLIAAAPELLESLLCALNRGYFDEHKDDSQQERDEKMEARATIAKATGEMP